MTRNITRFFRRWYWSQPYHIRRAFHCLPNWLFAIALGLTLAWFAAQGI